MKGDRLLGPKRSYSGFTVAGLLLCVALAWGFRHSLIPIVLDKTQPLIQWSSQYLDPGAFWWTWQAEQRDAEVRQLEAQNQRLYNQLAAMGHIVEENQELRQLLQLKMPTAYNKVSAEVILRAPHQWYETLVIDQGFEAGLAVNQVVVNGNGVVGKLIEVTAKTSRVQLISHPESMVSCLIGKSNVPGVLTGRYRQKPAHLRYLQNFAKLHSGDPVVTSGLGGVYPAGLVLGTIKTLRKQAALPSPEATVELSSLQTPPRFVVVLVPAPETNDNAPVEPDPLTSEPPDA